MSWNEETARKRIKASWHATEKVVVKRLVRETSLEDLSLNSAYEVDGVHVYVDVPNARALLGSDQERDHKKLLRFLNIMARVSHLVFQRTNGVKVDLQNTRIHFVVYKPYDAESERVDAAVAIAALLRDALLAGNALHEELPDARVVVGIESGLALAVRNGTRGDRELLFLGNPANLAAKLTGPSKAAGIYVGATARAALGDDYLENDPSTKPMTATQLDECRKRAALPVSPETINEEWSKELQRSPLSSFAFARWAPPIVGVSLDELTPANSRRQELAVLYADIDGFTSFVENSITSGTQVESVRVLHVIRKELREVLNDLEGRKVRYIGDCIQGLLVHGTSQTTDEAKTVRSAALCAAAMRSSFDLIQAEIAEASGLGLQIGLELGSTAVSRIGVQGSRDRVAISTSSIQAEVEQARCNGNETAIGPSAYEAASTAVRKAFGDGRKASDLNYDTLCAQLRRDESNAAAVVGTGATIPGAIRSRAYAR